MRLLSVRDDHGGRGVAQRKAEADRCGHRPLHYQHLPLRRLPTGTRGDSRRCERVKRKAVMNYMRKMSRRNFVVTAAAAGGGLALGLDIPLGGLPVTRAQEGSPEINAWGVVQRDDTLVIRVARPEMGQGTHTGLCPHFAAELECDWSKVTWEYPTPAQRVAPKRLCGDFATC